jgi:hypothetical protein
MNGTAAALPLPAWQALAALVPVHHQKAALARAEV